MSISSASEPACSFVMLYETKFTSVVRGHHVYKARWTPVIGVKLVCKNDKREEAKAYDDFAVSLYKDGKDSSGGSDCSDVSTFVHHERRIESSERFYTRRIKQQTPNPANTGCQKKRYEKKTSE